MNSFKTIFIFAYYSYNDPVFQSAVLPYFIGLNKLDPRLRFVLLTFEQKQFKMTLEDNLSIKKELQFHNIFWHQTNWHSGNLKLIKKIYDIIQTAFLSSYLILKYNVSIIYSEGFPGAVLGHWLGKGFNIKHIIHTFEPHTQYMTEAGVWKIDSWEAKLLRKYEIKVAKGASVILTATNAMITNLKKLNLKAEIYRVPSCVDTNVFGFSVNQRVKIREGLGIKNNEVVIASLGKFGGMYMDNEVFDFFKTCENFKKVNFKYFIFTNEPKNNIIEKITAANLPIDKFLIQNLKRNEVSNFLSASDFGLVAVRQNNGKRYCSPIKDGEYWACGLPLIIPKGISDDFIFAKENKIGIVMDNTSVESFNNVCSEIKKWQLLKKNEIVDRCISFAKLDRDVSNFNSLYKNIFLNN